ncbi:hypothetical protein DERP_011090 [Dermatophagoides pteronyssinus]|uniref:Uncharacterized protein n=2 Tax=Dermatophagoides pteronyssinus TaxID=6956 RepID=A0ABQ8J980_DERPT|nr:CAR1 transcription factor-like [Dermatophagoides pteronyssinus]KAH9418995.1 hypothetical protein DERP_011090 [Dermatophagoides pteronyssinus]
MLKFFLLISLCLTSMVNSLPTTTTITSDGHHDHNENNDYDENQEQDPETYLWNMATATASDDGGGGIQSFTDDELEEILNSMQLPANYSAFDFGGGLTSTTNNSNDKISKNSTKEQHGFVIIWRNPYVFANNNNNSESTILGRNGGGGGGEDDEDDDHPRPPHRHEFDEMEQRDFLRTVIFLANQQMRIKFHLCEMRRFRSHFVRRWNLYRCSARFTVARLGKNCDPNKTYDGYVNFIVQNPELPPLLAIRYYVFQFLYESSMTLVNKMNDHHVSLASIPNQLQQQQQQQLQQHQHQLQLQHQQSNDGEEIVMMHQPSSSDIDHL